MEMRRKFPSNLAGSTHVCHAVRASRAGTLCLFICADQSSAAAIEVRTSVAHSVAQRDYLCGGSPRGLPKLFVSSS